MKNYNPLISIIINCYNGEKYLIDCLESIKNQTYKNFEVIFWDNKSIDSSSKIFKKIADERFFYFLSESHTSLYKARNLALKKINGDFLCFLDADDMMKIDRLEKQIKFFLENNDLGVVYCNQEILNQITKRKSIFIKKNDKIDESLKILKRQSATILNSLIKKSELFKLKKYFNENYNIIGDLDLLFRLSKNCKFKYLNETLVTYRLHQNNYSKFNRDEEIEELDDMMSDFKSNDLFNSEELKTFQNTINLRKILNLIIKKNIKEAYKDINALQDNFLKIKLIFYLILPNTILKRLINF